MQKIKEKKYTKRLVISLTDNQYEQLRKEAYLSNLSIAEVIRQTLTAQIRS